MAHRSPARFLAPLALVAFALALFIVVNSSQTTGSGEPSAAPSVGDEQAAPNGEDGEAPRERKGPRFYTVKPGDTPSAIAEKTDVPLEDIERLNPDIDPQTLSPGTRIRLRR
jgi:LysM repeat protein